MVKIFISMIVGGMIGIGGVILMQEIGMIGHNSPFIGGMVGFLATSIGLIVGAKLANRKERRRK